ncbi:hypothetical protein DTO212C5_9256 [Paecilomyces variotii]|nr:hypothetical protein DTO212C5_9256 [Paecilomyces variotii]
MPPKKGKQREQGPSTPGEFPPTPETSRRTRATAAEIHDSIESEEHTPEAQLLEETRLQSQAIMATEHQEAIPTPTELPPVTNPPRPSNPIPTVIQREPEPWELQEIRPHINELEWRWYLRCNNEDVRTDFMARIIDRRYGSQQTPAPAARQYPVQQMSQMSFKTEAEMLQKQIDNTFERQKIPILREDGADFDKWSQQFELAASNVDIKDLDILQQQTPPRPFTWQWKTAQAAIRNWFMALLDTRILDAIQFKERDTVAEIWLELNKRFGVAKSVQRVELSQQLFELINLPTSTLTSTAFAKSERILSKLNELGADLEDVVHDWQIIYVTRQTPKWATDRFKEFYSTGTVDQPDIVNLDMQEVLLDLTQYRKALSSTKSLQRQTATTSTAASNTRSTQRGSNTTNGSNTANNSNATSASTESKQTTARTSELCSFCSRGYHTAEECWSAHPELRPPFRRQQGQRNRSSNTNPDPTTTTSSQTVLKIDSISAQPGATPADRPAAGNWILDTGSEAHITTQKDVFLSFTETKSPIVFFEGIHKERIPSKGTGSILVQFDDVPLFVKDVHYAPGANDNILSFALLKEQGHRIWIGPDDDYFNMETPEGSRFHGRRIDGERRYLILPAYPPMQEEVYQAAPVTTRSSKGEDPAVQEANPKPLEPPAPRQVSRSLVEWHRILAHLNPADILRLARDPLSGIKIEGSKDLPFCDVCKQAKITKLISRRPMPRAVAPGRRLHMDIIGGGRTLDYESDEALPSDIKMRYALLVTDDATRYRWVYPMPDRAHLLNWIHFIVEHIHSLGFTVAHLRSDNELHTNAIAGYCANRGIMLESTAAYTPWQDGVSERAVRTIMERARAMVIDSGMPHSMWAYAVEYAVHVTNRVPTSVPLFNDRTPGATSWDRGVKPVKWRVPIQAWLNRPVAISNLHRYGAPGYYLLTGPKAPAHKLAPKAKPAKFVGMADDSNALMWDLASKQVVRTPHFNIDDVAAAELKGSEPRVVEPAVSLMLQALAECGSQASRAGEEEPDDEDPTGVWRRPANSMKVYAISFKEEQSTPRSFKAATTGPEATQWWAAMRKEIDLLVQRKCWHLVRRDELPSGTRPIPGRWVYKKKEAPDGSTVYKARWVIRGNVLDDTTFDMVTYAPVVSAATTNILFACAAHYGWVVLQADAVQAFLNGKLRYDVYMLQPMGFQEGEKGVLVCKLDQALYGLTPSAKIWYDTLAEYLLSAGFRISPYDPCLWISFTTKHVFVTTHVDDFNVIAPTEETAQEVLKGISERFEMKSLGPVKHYLGMEVSRGAGVVQLTQSGYAREFVQSFGWKDFGHVDTPLDSKLQIDDEPTPEINIEEYQRGVGCCQWLVTKTRPDLAKVTSLLAERNTRPTPKSYTALKRVIRYLQRTTDYGITYYKGDGDIGLPQAYCDSDHAGDTNTRFSTSGFVFMLAGGPVSWKTRKQTCVAISSNEAEYVAASEAAREAWWIRRLMIDMGVTQVEGPITLNIDNDGAQDLIKSPSGTKRSKHIDIRFHYVRDMLAQGVIDVKRVDSADNLADGFTKGLPVPKFKTWLEQLGLTTTAQRL